MRLISSGRAEQDEIRPQDQPGREAIKETKQDEGQARQARTPDGDDGLQARGRAPDLHQARSQRQGGGGEEAAGEEAAGPGFRDERQREQTIAMQPKITEEDINFPTADMSGMSPLAQTDYSEPMLDQGNPAPQFLNMDGSNRGNGFNSDLNIHAPSVGMKGQHRGNITTGPNSFTNLPPDPFKDLQALQELASAGR